MQLPPIRPIAPAPVSLLALAMVIVGAPACAEQPVAISRTSHAVTTSVYPGDLSDRFQETTVFAMDSVCRINQYFVSHPNNQTQANCALDSAMTYDPATDVLRIDDYAGVVFDLDNLNSAGGSPAGVSLGDFYKISVTLVDEAQTDATALVTLLDNLWDAPTRDGLSVGIQLDHYAYHYASTDMTPDPATRDFIENFAVTRRDPPSPGQTKDVVIDIYVTPRGNYPVINGINLSSLPDQPGGSFTSQRDARYLILAKWQDSSAPVRFKDVRITQLDDATTIDEVNAHFIKRVVDSDAFQTMTANSSNFVGLDSFQHALWSAFLYRGHDYYFKTHRLADVRAMIALYLAYLPEFVNEAEAAYKAVDKNATFDTYCDTTAHTVEDVNHCYINRIQSNPMIVYALSSYLTASQRTALEAQFQRLVTLVVERIAADGSFPPTTQYVADTFAEESSWIIALLTGFYAAFPDNPQAPRVREALIFMAYHHLSTGGSIAGDFPSIAFPILDMGQPLQPYRTFSSHYVRSDGTLENHGNSPSVNYGLGATGLAAIARNIIAKEGLDVPTIDHNLELVFNTSVASYLGTDHLRHDQPIDIDLSNTHCLEQNVDRYEKAGTIIHDFFGCSGHSRVEDWGNTYTNYNVYANVPTPGMTDEATHRQEALTMARSTYYLYYTGAGKMVCGHGEPDPSANVFGCNASTHEFYSYQFGDALYAMAFSMYSGFDPTAPILIGETGRIDDSLTHASQTIQLQGRYQNPIVFATTPSRDGTDPSVVRVTEVHPDRFTLFVDEAPDRDGAHTTESVSWVVMEAGPWTVDGGHRVQAGLVYTNASVGPKLTNQWASRTYSEPMPATPVVLSQVQTSYDPTWVKTRLNAVGQAGFDVALEGAESADAPHGSEVIGWMAIAPGVGSWNGLTFAAGTTGVSVTDAWTPISFGAGFATAPNLVAAMQTYRGSDCAGLRYDRASLTSVGVHVKVEEDTTRDSETVHTAEAVGYLAIEGNGLLTGLPADGGW